VTSPSRSYVPPFSWDAASRSCRVRTARGCPDRDRQLPASREGTTAVVAKHMQGSRTRVKERSRMVHAPLSVEQKGARRSFRANRQGQCGWVGVRGEARRQDHLKRYQGRGTPMTAERTRKGRVRGCRTGAPPFYQIKKWSKEGTLEYVADVAGRSSELNPAKAPNLHPKPEGSSSQAPVSHVVPTSALSSSERRERFVMYICLFTPSWQWAWPLHLAVDPPHQG
jgi:hypothetical protein